MRTLHAACITLFAASIASASPCSSGGTLSSYIALGATGCTVGNTLFNDFASLAIPTGATQIDPSMVTVTPTAAMYDQTLTFNINANVDNANFSDLDIGFEASPLPSMGVLNGATVSLISPGFTQDGSVTGILDICPAGVFDAMLNCSTTDVETIVTDVSGFTDLTEGASFGPSSTAAFSADIGVDPGMAGTASLGAASVTVDATPEPAGLGFLGCVAMAAALMYRARGQKVRGLLQWVSGGKNSVVQ